MARIVCQVVKRSKYISFLWSEGAACFEPYHLNANQCEHLLSIARLIQARIADGTSGPELARLGHQLYRALFRLDDGNPEVSTIHSWLMNLAQVNQVEKLEFLADEPGTIPWNVLIDEIPSAESLQLGGEGWKRFWGARFNIGSGRRVNALRQIPRLKQSSHLFAADPTLIQQLSQEERSSLNAFQEEQTICQSAESLAEAMKKRQADVVMLLARFDHGRLYLGPDALGSADLHAWLKESTDASPEPAVVLMGSGTIADQAAWQAFLSHMTTGVSGLIANEVLLPPGRILGIGLNLTRQLLQGQNGLGEILRTLRLSTDAAGLAFSAFCPPELRVSGNGSASTETETQAADLPLPDQPYHPFAAYDAADRPLFFGRQDETLACAAVVDQAHTRVVLLHGSPAVGKTSFLQAGLIPYLEQDSVGYRVLRDRTPLDGPVAEMDYPILILRCTNDLASQVADALSVFCAQPFVYTTPLGAHVTVDLPGLLQTAVAGQAAGNEPSTAFQSASIATGIAHKQDDASEAGAEEVKGSTDLSVRELWIALRDKKDLLAQVLHEITRSLPFELLIAVDQGDELITLVRNPKQQERRQKALDMLAQLSEGDARCKLVFTLRSQYVGPFLSLFPDGNAPIGWRSCCLPMLSESAMVDTLMLPTHRTHIPHSNEIPFQKYRFSFEEGTARKIVAQANSVAAADQQSPLSILHAVGSLLYERQVVEKHEGVVRLAHLREIGGVKDALTKCLDMAIKRLSISKASQKALRELIGKLHVTHSDGTLSRDLVRAAELKQLWKTSPEPVAQIVNTAAERGGLFEIQQLLIGGQQDVFVSLPQDSLAQLGKNIQEADLRALARTRVVDTLWIMIPLAFLAAAVSFWLTRSIFGGVNEDDVKQKVISEIRDDVKKLEKLAELRGRSAADLQMRQPLYNGLLAQADQALRAGNALRARQILLAQPASRSFGEGKDDKVPDLRGFEWYYLWKQLNSERLLFEGHQSLVTAVAVSPDSKRVASASHDGTIRVYSLTHGEILARLGDSKRPIAIHAVAFAPDGKTLASAGADKMIRLWDLSGLKTEYIDMARESRSLQGQSDVVHALAFGKDANSLASAGADNEVVLWDVAQGKQKHNMKEHAVAVHSLAFTADGKTMVSAGADGQIIVWDADAGKKRQTINTPFQTLATIAIAPDGKTVGAGGVEVKLDAERGMIRFWDLSTAKETLAPIQHAAGVFTLVFQPDGKAIASGGKDRVVRLWDIATGQERRHWIGHLGWVRSVAFAPDGSTLVSGSYDQTVKAWNPAQSPGPDVISAHADGVQCVALDRTNALLASGSLDGSVKLWNAANGKLALKLPAHEGAVTSLAFSAHLDKPLLAVGTRGAKNEGEIKIWMIESDPKQGYKANDRHTLKVHRKGITALAFCPVAARADLLVSGSADQTVILWDAANGKEKETYRGHKDEVRCVAFTADGLAFASGGKDRRVCVYEVDRKGHAILDNLHLGSIESVALFTLPVFGPEGRGSLPGLLTASTDQTMRLWVYDRTGSEMLAKKEMQTFRSHVQPLTGVLHNEHNGVMHVSCSADHSIKIYDLLNERFTLLGHTGAVRAIALASDQSFLASASDDGTIRIWRTHRDRTTAKVEVK